jgi:CheY-like chemotaxis protein
VKLLIVDDIDANRRVLRAILEAEGHATLEAADGVEALQILDRETVDVVLSDILMPRMDGYRLCHEIRTNDRLRHLPFVIYTSTYTSPRDEKLAISIGADRYLKKPAPLRDILAALQEAIAAPRAALQPKALDEIETLKEYSDRLVTKLEKKIIELDESNQRLTILDRAKNDFLSVISHEFRTPLNGLLGVGKLILADLSSTKEHRELAEAFDQSRQRILAILEDALLLTEIDVNGKEFKSASVSWNFALTCAVDRATEFATSRQVSITKPSTPFVGRVVGVEDLLIRSLHALIETAVKFSEEGETVRVSHEVVADSQRIYIEGHGRMIPVTAVPNFFDVFSIGEWLTPGGDLGLGPAVAYRVLSLFGASVSVANRDPAGIRLTVSLKGAATSG